MGRLSTHEEFLNHSGNLTSGGNYLAGWHTDGLIDPKNPTCRYIEVWLHTICVPQPRWAHGAWRKIEHRENKETKIVSREIWSDKFVCHEEERILKRQYSRTEDGHRTDFPEFCPACRLAECVYQLVTTGKVVVGDRTITQGKLSWTEPLFVYEGTDASKNVVLHAGGIYNGYKDVEANSAEGEALKAVGIYPGTAWRENTLAKLTYMFAVVDNADVAKGVQVAEEPSLLGEKVRDVISKSRASLSTEGDDAGNPFVKPFAFRLMCDNNKKLAFNKRYDAMKMERIPLTEQISTLIRSQPRDWFKAKLTPSDPSTFYANLKKQATPEALRILPWDFIFAGVNLNIAGQAQGQQAAPAPAQAQQPAPQAAPRRTKIVPPPPPEPERVPCDDCGYMMLPTESKCAKCGAQYQLDGQAAQPAPPVAAVFPPPSAPRANGTVAAPQAAPVQDPGGDFDSDGEDDLPF